MAERFSASNAAKHMACPASANLELAILGWQEPAERTEGAAARGTAMHEMFAHVASLPRQDMARMIDALNYVCALRATRRFKVVSERSFTAEWLVSKPSTTPDLVLYVQDEIHVLDLKTGKIPVEVIGNEQLLYYALCVAHLAPLAKGVTLHIVQPWADGNTSWFADTLVLKQFMADAQAAEAKILAGDTTFGPSDHCKFCPANPHSRSEKGSPLCPPMLQLLYPRVVDESAILALD